MPGCAHEQLRHVTVETTVEFWAMRVDGTYVPDPDAGKALEEQEQWWECAVCGEQVSEPVREPEV